MTGAPLRKCLGVALLGIMGTLNACTYWGGDLERICDESERDYSRDLVGPFTEVPLKAVLANPSGYKFTNVRFDAIINRVAEKVFVPFWTTIAPEEYISFSAWPVDAKLWMAEDRAKSHPFFFVNKSGPNLGDLAAAHRFSLVRLSCTVMGDYEMKAWIEVNRIEIIEPSVYTEASLADLALARQAMMDKKPAVAIRQYENSLNGIWTAGLRLDIHLSLARLYEGRGDLQSALRHYEEALINAPENEEALKGIDRTKAAMSGRAAEAPQQ